MIVKLALTELPAASVAVHVTVVVPSAKTLPERVVQEVVTAPDSSDALIAKLTTAEVLPRSLPTDIAAGTINCGVTVSFRVWTPGAAARLPSMSVSIAETDRAPSASEERSSRSETPVSDAIVALPETLPTPSLTV